MRDLSIKGRIILSKTEGLSRLLYPAISLDVPNNIILRKLKYESKGRFVLINRMSLELNFFWSQKIPLAFVQYFTNVTKVTFL